MNNFHNFDPYEKMVQMDIRIGLMENCIRELQMNQLQLSKMLEQQTNLIRQLQQNEQVLNEAVGTCLLQQQNILKS